MGVPREDIPEMDRRHKHSARLQAGVDLAEKTRHYWTRNVEQHLRAGDHIHAARQRGKGI